jgi:hypothetical protein
MLLTPSPPRNHSPPAPFLLTHVDQSVNMKLPSFAELRLLSTSDRNTLFPSSESPKEFTRADNKHDEILRWLKDRHSPVLYLTGEPGSGKSSILLAWVIPKLSKDDPSFKVIQLRGYQDPLAALVSKLREAGIIWEAPPADVPIHLVETDSTL